VLNRWAAETCLHPTICNPGCCLTALAPIFRLRSRNVFRDFLLRELQPSKAALPPYPPWATLRSSLGARTDDNRHKVHCIAWLTGRSIGIGFAAY
jgi:hypothetical protein